MGLAETCWELGAALVNGAARVKELANLKLVFD